MTINVKDRAVEPHDDEEHDGEYDIEDDRHRMTREELPDMLQFTHPGHCVSHSPRLKVRQGERQNMWNNSAPSPTSIRFVV